jgi:hypothetical protein
MPDNPKPISPLRQRMIDDMTARRFRSPLERLGVNLTKRTRPA